MFVPRLQSNPERKRDGEKERERRGALERKRGWLCGIYAKAYEVGR